MAEEKGPVASRMNFSPALSAERGRCDGHLDAGPDLQGLCEAREPG